MDTRMKKIFRRPANEITPDSSLKRPRTSKLEEITTAFLKGTPSPLKFATKEEMERRENDEVCAKHGNPIVAFEEKTGTTLCEKCVYMDDVEHPVFTAVVAKDIKKRFDVEYKTFEVLCDELKSIDQNEVRHRIQDSVTKFFDAIREKCDELEEKTVARIENSTNLNGLVETLEGMHQYMETNRVSEKYDTERTKLDIKVSEIRYTYVCHRKQKFDETISNLQSDNQRLSDAVEKAKAMINAIYECTQEDPQVPKTLNELVSSLMLIDKKHPDFNDEANITRRAKEVYREIEEESGEMVKQEINFSSSGRDENNWKAEEMREGYFNKDNSLYKRELIDGRIEESEVMKLKLHLQKVITVPTARSSRVFLMGGSKDPEGKQAIHNCYEVNLKKKTLSAIEKLSSPKLSFAAALSPDGKEIYIAGGSSGENKSTNEVELFDVLKKKWTRLPNLNQPRFSGSLILCENTDLYCFGGVDNDPKDPTKFLTLKSIETLNIAEENSEWETLNLSLPYKTSSPGAISLGHRAFIVFGGWNKITLKNSVIIRGSNSGEYETEESNEMASEDTFVFNGLVSRNSYEKKSIVFGTNNVHVYDEINKSFSLLE